MTWIEENLVTTLSKKRVLEVLKEWRSETKSKVEADLLADLLDEVRSGALDG